MKNIYKIFIFSALVGLFFTSCEKEETGLVPEKQAEQDKFLTADEEETIKLNETSFSTTKTTFTEKQIFLDGGSVVINGLFLPTKIVGDQRWITVDYFGQIPNVTPFYEGGTSLSL